MTNGEELKAKQAELAFDQYTLAFKMALTDFQFIEESLRLYISVAYDFIRHKLNGELPFHLDESDVQKDALGRLIDKYAKLSDNQKFVAELRGLTKDRNKIVHSGLIVSVEEQRDIEFLDAETQRLNELHTVLKPHIETLMNERAALTGEKPVSLGGS